MGVTWRCVLKLFFLVVVNDDVRLHRDQFLLVKLPQVQQSEFIKLLVAEEHLWASKPINSQYRGDTMDTGLWGAGAWGLGKSSPEASGCLSDIYTYYSST